MALPAAVPELSQLMCEYCRALELPQRHHAGRVRQLRAPVTQIRQRREEVASMHLAIVSGRGPDVIANIDDGLSPFGPDDSSAPDPRLA